MRFTQRGGTLVRVAYNAPMGEAAAQRKAKRTVIFPDRTPIDENRRSFSATDNADPASARGRSRLCGTDA
jgi:hypothetical protein